MHVAIIGNGITGISAAIRLRKRRPGWDITVISGESEYHFSRPALMYIFMGHLRFEDTLPFDKKFFKHQRIDLMQAWVTKIDTENKMLVFDGQTQPLGYDKLLIATGSEPNKFGWPGQDLRGVQSLYSLQDLDLLYRNVRGAQHAVVVGGGLIGIEFAEMLHARDIGVTFLVRETAFWNVIIPDEEACMINRIIEEEGLGLVLETELDHIVDGGDGRVSAVRTNSGETIACQVVGLTTGVHPNTHLAKTSGVPTGRGILVDRSLRTSIDDVYAAGDCAEMVTGEERNLIQQVWYTGRGQGLAVADAMAGDEVRYDPGIWFNSAKFLDLEYQVYGTVPRTGAAPPGHTSLFWMHPDGRHSLRIVHNNGTVVGFNLFGIRYRHEVCERWIREKRSVDYVLAHLAEANFDPEFYGRYEVEITAAMKRQVA